MHNQKITLTTIVEVIIREEELLVVIEIFTENANLTENQNLHSSSSCNCFRLVQQVYTKIWQQNLRQKSLI